MIDPVELAIIGPIYRSETGFEHEVENLKFNNFKSEYFTSLTCRTAWDQINVWLEEGTYTSEKLMSFILKSPIFGDTGPARSIWLADVGLAGTIHCMMLNGIELIERSLREEAQEAITNAPGGTANELITALDAKFAVIRQKAFNQATDEKKEACRELIAELEAAERGEQVMRSSRISSWDQALGGLPDAQLIVLAGRPGGGKTSLSEQIIDEAVRCDSAVLYIQRELSRSRAVGRLAARKARVPWSKVEFKKLSASESERMKQSVREYEKLPLFLAPIGNCNGSTLGPLLRFHGKHHGVKLVVIDYLQLIDIPKNVERRIAIGDATRALKLAANETGATVIAIAQLDRGLDRSATQPRLADLRESGDIEQNADSVLALWTSKDREEASVWPVNWSILKNRNGPLGSVEIMFDGPAMSFIGKTTNQRSN